MPKVANASISMPTWLAPAPENVEFELRGTVLPSKRPFCGC